MGSTEPKATKRSARERNLEAERQARAHGFRPLTLEALEQLAAGTADEAADLLDVSARLRERRRMRRRRCPS